MQLHIFFIKDDDDFLGSLTQEDKNFYMSLDLDLESYDKASGFVKEFETLQEFFQFVENINSDGVIVNIDKNLGVCVYVFNE